MYSWLAWTILVTVAVILGAVGYWFCLRTLRWFALAVVLFTAGYLIHYGLTHAAENRGSLSGAFTRGADTLGGALIRPLSLGHHVPAPGRTGWLVIMVLLVFGYRELEAWTLRRQAPCLDVSELTSDRQDDAAGTAPAAPGKLRHEWLVAELKFRLPAVEVRSPAIYPGGSRPSGLASIAESSGVSGAGLAGAIIRFFGMVWPGAPKLQVRAWVERTPGHEGIDDPTRVTVSLANPQSGAAVATKTLAARNLDDAVAAVAGYVARHIFARDRTVPSWCVSATDGTDLAALLLARQVRGYPECRSRMSDAWQSQIKLLDGVARRDLCAGVVRYELAQVLDLTGAHVDALLLHAANREQYPRFFRARYRLAMSLEILANPQSGLDEIDMATLQKALRILDRCYVTDSAADDIKPSVQADLTDELRRKLLGAARDELQAIQQYLTWWHIIWGRLRYREERAILRPYLGLRHRQAFHDGVRAALLLVAVRQALLTRPGEKLGRARKISRIVAAISGDSTAFSHVLHHFPARTGQSKPITKRQRSRRWPWQYRTPSWPAAYNLACAYAALAAYVAPGSDVGPLVSKVISSLAFALCNPECEMERPSEWIGNDPDLSWLVREQEPCFTAFLRDQQKRDYPVPG